MNPEDFMNPAVPASEEGYRKARADLAKIYWSMYSSFIEAGFSAAQAFDLLMLHSEHGLNARQY